MDELQVAILLKKIEEQAVRIAVLEVENLELRRRLGERSSSSNPSQSSDSPSPRAARPGGPPGGARRGGRPEGERLAGQRLAGERLAGEAELERTGPEQGPLVHVRALGVFRVMGPDAEELTPVARKARAIVAYLALRAGGLAERGELARLLWSDRGRAQAAASLRQALCDVRAAFGTRARHVLFADQRRVGLELARCRVDVERLDGLACEEAAGAGILVGLDGCDPVFDDWLRGERAVQRVRLLGALRRRFELVLEAGAHDEVMRWGTALLRLDPTDEGTHRALMRHHVGRNEPAAAAAQYRACVDALRLALGIEPSPETAALGATIGRRSSPRPRPASVDPTPLATVRVALELRLGAIGPREAAAARAFFDAALARDRRFQVLAPGSAEDVEAPRYLVRVTLQGMHAGARGWIELVEGASRRVLWTERCERAGDVPLDEDGDLRRAIAAIAAQLHREADKPREVRPPT